jgi:hypothetical protein
MKVEVSRQIFERRSNTKFRINPSSGIQVVSCGRTEVPTEIHDDANNRFSQFCEKRLKIPFVAAKALSLPYRDRLVNSV